MIWNLFTIHVIWRGVYLSLLHMFFRLQSFESLLYTLNTTLVTDMWLANIFPAFASSVVSFDEQKLLILMESVLSFFLLWILCSVSYLIHFLPNPGSQRFSAIFYYSVLAFKSKVYFESTVYNVRYGLKFFIWKSIFSSIIYYKHKFIFYRISFVLLLKIKRSCIYAFADNLAGLTYLLSNESLKFSYFYAIVNFI
jgi:hypothetical protein